MTVEDEKATAGAAGARSAAGAAAAGSAPAAAAGDDRRFSISRAVKDRQLVDVATMQQQQALDPILFLSCGRTVTLYEEASSSGSISARRASVFLRESSSTLFWCEPGRREEAAGRSFPLAALTDIFVGKQSPVMQKAATRAAANQCFSLVSLKPGAAASASASDAQGKALAQQPAKLSLHIEEESPLMVKAWVEALQAALKQGGGGRRLEAEGKTKDGDRRYSVTKLGAAGTAGAAGGTAMTRSQAVRTLSAGRQVIRLDASAGSAAAVFLFYHGPGGSGSGQGAGHGKLGSLYYCPPGQLEYSAARRLDLTRLTDLFVGKQHPAWRASPAGQKASEAGCFSMVAGSGADAEALHIQEENKEAVLLWVDALR
jgi:hypothetical protein